MDKEDWGHKNPVKDGENEISEAPEKDRENRKSEDLGKGGKDIRSEAAVDQKEDAKKITVCHTGILKIAVIRLPRISNFTDFNVLQAMDGVQVTYVSKVSELGEPHMVILPGTKSTIADLRWLRESGLEAAVLKLHSRGVTIFGICGGFQMLGEKISDPLGVETAEEGVVVSEISNGKGNGVSDRESGQNQKKGSSFIAGMGILPLETVFEGEKVRRRITGTSGKLTGEYTMASEKHVSGYEIHMGRTAAVKCRDNDRSEKESVPVRKKECQSHENPKTDFGETGWQAVGLIYQKEHVFGTYVHGIFDGREFRESFLDVVAKRNNIGLAAQTVTDYRTYKQLQYDKLADVVRGGMDMKKFYEILGLFPDRYFSGEKGWKSDGSRRSRETGRGYLHLYYGNGKGKTTAAVGLAVRAAGAGKKVVFCQFLKSGETGELSVLGCTPGIRILRSGERFGFSWTLSEEEKARLREIHTNLFTEAIELAEAGQCDVLILDEVCDALQKKLMDEELFYRWLETVRADGGAERSSDQSGISAVQADGTGQKNGTGRNFQKIYGCEWVLTGRNPDERILAAADYVTQMKKERHPFDDGVKARRGIEY
ncbi:MAG: cob(I)yrinic acid a,c-diamide adenosyltransferase [Lachnospiraceae bacterium]|nr:cob(I)yrinic acid a,c-diamide adenosyltransferase [Lachnospiraceae bacterium]